MAAKGIIKQEVRWNIGKGHNVHIWEGKWLPTNSSTKLLVQKGLLEMESLSQALLIMTYAYGRLNQFETPSSPMKRMKSYESP